jgi:hypothetical protein
VRREAPAVGTAGPGSGGPSDVTLAQGARPLGGYRRGRATLTLLYFLDGLGTNFMGMQAVVGRQQWGGEGVRLEGEVVAAASRGQWRGGRFGVVVVGRRGGGCGGEAREWRGIF